MKTLFVISLLAALAIAQEPPTKPQHKLTWKPATYESLVIGRSTESDMLHVFGKPEWSSQPEHGHVEHWYSRKEPNRYIAVTVSKGVIREIAVDFPQGLSRDDAVKTFGRDFRAVRFSADWCIGDESSPMYPDKDGDLELLVYPSRGIVLWPGSGGIASVIYTDHPPGEAKSHCKGKGTK